MRSQKFPRLDGICLSWLCFGLFFVTSLSAQDADGFRAEVSGEVSAVRDAPCTLVLQALDARGEVLSSFDWTKEGLRLEGLADPDGGNFVGIPKRPRTESGERYQVDQGNLRTEVDRVYGGAVGQVSFTADGGTLTLSSVVLVADAVVVVQEEKHFEVVEGTIFPWAAIIPPLIAIFLAILTRQVLVALFAGVWIGMWSITGESWGGFLQTVTEVIPGSLDSSRIKILIFSCLLGSVVALVARMGGTQALVSLMTRFGKTPRGAQITTWLAGILIFFDDYANALLVGNTMRPVTDRFRVSREKLSFLVDATSAPVACVFIISTWIAAEIGYIEGKLGTDSVQAATGLEPSGAYEVFLSTIPYNFYPFLCLFFGLMVCLLGRDFGPMLKAEQRARLDGKLLADGASPLSSKEMDELEPADPSRLHWYNAVLPIGCVIFTVVVMLYSTGSDSIGEAASDLSAKIVTLVENGAPATDVAAAKMKLATLENPPLRSIFGAADSYNALLLASALGVLVAALLAMSQKLLPLREVVDVATAGIKAMVPAALILILAWSLQSVCERLNTSQFLIHHVSFTLNFLPAAVFVLAAVVGFSTGTSWGTMGILIPLTIDYAVGMATDQGLGQPEVRAVLASSVGAVLAGAVFGDHCSPISDTTIMSSMASGADHMDHVRTQMPYALTVALVALLCGYIPAGFGISPMICLPVGLVVLVGILMVFGRKVETN